ncbi:MAG TPA: NUDIX domain-containing protein [Kiritimatiellia bacterium]|nr:NUDIX domain-containing protein [Kiritimatiellia bacterium]HMO98590.1 NUDIX domain-containing protein [Kiritimatiellia bacterium]HMP95431.1 NUDIX domain-containing protein [Kiritimatiellia bacterium]
MKKGKTTSAGGVVINPQGQVLIVNQRGNSWSLPKGHVDEGEDLLAAARREIFEESGVSDLRFVSELGSFERARIGKQGGEDTSEMKTLHFFLFITRQMTLCPQDKDNPEARWVELEEASALLTHPKDQAFFSGILPEVRRALSLP